jgi:hypothetical protein
MENKDPGWNHVVPFNPPLIEGITFHYMKPIELFFDWAPTNFVNDYPRVTSGEILAHQTPPNERTDRIRMALKDNPIHRFLADLERIPFYARQQLHRSLGNIGNRMEVGGHNDRLSPIWIPITQYSMG